MGELRAHALVRIKNIQCYRKRSSPQNYKEPKMTDRKAVIKNADMSEDMQQDAVDCATQAIEKYNIEKKEDTSRLVPYTIGQDLMIYE
ncbi:unnamed protein product [Psylliodes chrysocephalus]|uniref:Dynein light chain n=1 Tax=Psylliodes chrysocephalus TaxID=3402493 RepID=A0A9P0G760_9CUCU|nr:unnamed protein product [Psylliodes chrysocephala]